jgi:DNA topoisomerase-1
VCEKPDAAERVARSLDENAEPRKRDLQGVPFFECKARYDTIVVCSALGHLYAVESKGRSNRRYYPVWDFGWKSRHEVERTSARLARWVRVISSLAKDAERFVNACDYDIEGSLIGHTILQYACNGAHSKAERMKFSTMTEKELKAAFRTLSPRLDFLLVEAGRCRHELDWLYGINLSRIMTESVVKQGKGYATLSTGRVQGPTLAFVVEREEEIGCFVPTPFWTIESTVEYEGRDYRTEYYKEKIPTLQEAEQIVSECKRSLLVVRDVESREFQQPPPFPFDISSLQSEAFQHFGYSPARTLTGAERLYLDALISYPRTSSQKLPPDIGYFDILRGISSQRDYRSLARKLLSMGRLHPTQGSREDQAHPAIYPTGESPGYPLTGPEAGLYNLIVRRFMAAFAQPCLRQRSRIILEHEHHRFFLRGSQILEACWTEFYRPYLSEDAHELPSLGLGVKLPLCDVNALEKFTQPPPRYNPNSLLKRMEEENIGTKATRAQIV